MPQKRTSAAGKTYWRGRVRGPDGKERGKSFTRRADAKAWEEEQRASMRTASWVDSADRATVADALDRWASRPGLRASSRRAYKTVADNLDWLGGVRLQRLTRRDVDDWHRQLVSGRPWTGETAVTAPTARQWMMIVSAALSLAVEEGHLARNPVRAPKVSASRAVSRSDIPTVEDVGAICGLLDAGGAVYVDGRGRHVQRPQPVVADMVRTAVGTGLRVSELCGLTVGRVDFLGRVVHVEAQASPNGKVLVGLKTRASRRSVPVADDLLAVLDRRCAGKGPDERVFTTSRGVPLGHTRAGEHLRVAAAHLGMGWTFHSLRHFYASLLIARGVPVSGVQHALGHDSASTTLGVYTHLWPGASDVTRRAVEGVVGPLVGNLWENRNMGRPAAWG